jgi:hypothetical protein
MALLDEVSVSEWQDLFTSIIEDADSNILLLDEDFRILTLNPGFYWIKEGFVDYGRDGEGR